jgi:hypothetical protein
LTTTLFVASLIKNKKNMFATIEEGLELYKKEIRSFRKWYKDLGYETLNDMLTKISKGDKNSLEYKDLYEKTNRLYGMKIALGITKKDDKEIHNSVFS